METVIYVIESEKPLDSLKGALDKPILDASTPGQALERIAKVCTEEEFDSIIVARDLTSHQATMHGRAFVMDKALGYDDRRSLDEACQKAKHYFTYISVAKHPIKYIVGRPINGVTLNGLEYIMVDEDNVKTFNCMDDVEQFLLNNGWEEDKLRCDLEDGSLVVEVLDEDEDFAAVRWHVDDVLSQVEQRDDGKKLTRSEARLILKEIVANHDCTIGITWEVIDIYIDKHFEAIEASKNNTFLDQDAK